MLRLLNFQVDTLVGLFWIMLRYLPGWSSLRPSSNPFYTIYIISVKIVYTAYCILRIIYSCFFKCHHFLHVIDPLYGNNNNELQSFRNINLCITETLCEIITTV